MKTLVSLFLFGCVLVTAAFCHSAEISLEALLLAPSPEQKLYMKGALETEMDQILAVLPRTDAAFLKSKIDWSAAARKALASSEIPLVLSRDNPLIVSIQHLCELYLCKPRLRDGRLQIRSVLENAEFEAREYRMSPALVAFVLGEPVKKGAGVSDWIHNDAVFKRMNQRLEAMGLRMMDGDEDGSRLVLRGESRAHDRFQAQIAILIGKALDADWQSRSSSK